jgi:hypothetical protein
MISASMSTAQPTWAAPRIDRLRPDRVDRGEEVTITGEHLGESGDTVIVNLDPDLHLPLPEPNPTVIRLTVPATAVTGPVTVTVRRRLPDGGEEEQTSNPAFLMVIWHNIGRQQIGITGYVEALLPGESDAIYLVESRIVPAYQLIKVWRVKDYRERVPVTSLYNVDRADGFYPPQTTQINVRDQTAYALYTGFREPDQDLLCGGLACDVVEIRAFPDARPILATRVRYSAEPWVEGGNLPPLDFRVTNFTFEADGSLLVIAELDPAIAWVQDDPVSPWRVVVLRPRIYNLWRFPRSAFSGEIKDLATEPALLPAPQVVGQIWGSHEGYSSLASSREGHTLVRWADYHSAEQHFHIVPAAASPEPVETVDLAIPRCEGCSPDDNFYWIHGTVTADCMGRFYVMSERIWPSGSVTGPIYRVVRDDFGAWQASLLAPAWLIPGDPLGAQTYPKSVAADSRGNLYEADWYTAHRFSPAELIDPYYYDDFFCPETARLALHVEGLDAIVDEDGQRVTVALGQRRELKAYWVDDQGGKELVPVTWELRDPEPHWQEEHPDAESMHRVLFPDDVLLLFDEGHPEVAIDNRIIWPVHKGRVTVKLHLAAEDSPDNQPHERTVTMNVTYDAVPLGAGPSQFDPSINTWANAFGVPPQYMKALIDKESGFDAVAYRYEPKKWDYGQGELTRVMKLVERGDAYIQPFQFGEPADSGIGPRTQGPSLTQSDMDGRARGTNTLYTLEGDPPVCAEVGLGRGDVRAWALYLGSNGVRFAADDPRNRRSDCGQRMNWDVGIDIYTFDQLKAAPADHEAAWWFFKHPSYVGQMFAAASYGLTQVGYHMAIRSMQWRSAAPGTRNWPNVTDETNLASNNNIYLGARWLVTQYFDKYRGLRERARRRKDDFELLLASLLKEYNASWAYSEAVRAGATAYTPTYTPMLEAP